MYNMLFVLMCAYITEISQIMCAQLYIHAHKPSIHHLIIQLFVKLAYLLLILLPLLLRDVNHNGGGERARAAGAADVEKRLLGFGRRQGDVL